LEVIDLLSRFEDVDFIHPYIRFGDDRRHLERLELPRINMVFTLKDGQWQSRDYRWVTLVWLNRD